MVHFLFYAGRAMIHKYEGDEDPIGSAVSEGRLQEIADILKAPWSAFSYEDLPSDRLGAEFAINHFDPNSELTLGQQIQSFLTTLGATTPQNAPNWNLIPQKDTRDRPLWLNITTTGRTKFTPPAPSPPYPLPRLQ